jgi:probable rRNA maturation factor
LADFVLSAEKVRGPVELALDLTGHKRIRGLNRRFRGVDRTTDVISFRNDTLSHPHPPTPSPLSRERVFSPSPYLREKVAGGRVRVIQGDLAINVQQAALQAKKMRHPLKREIRLLFIHGILHLLGYTDYEPKPRRRMFKRQNALLRNWERKHP